MSAFDGHCASDALRDYALCKLTFRPTLNCTYWACLANCDCWYSELWS